MTENTKFELYENAFHGTITEYVDNRDKDLIKKAIVYGVKMINTEKVPEVITGEYLHSRYEVMQFIKACMSTLTLKEFMRLYPPEKDFKSGRYGFKDYFYTMNYVKGIKMNEPIGEGIFELLWEYQNRELIKFNIEVIETASDLDRLARRKSLGEQFADIMGFDTCTMHTGPGGKQFLIDKNGRTKRLKKSRPRHLKVLKGNQP